MKALILGASGLAGAAIMKAIRAEGWAVSGTYRTLGAYDGAPAMLHFDLSAPQSIVPLLEDADPDVVISCLRGNFDCQLKAHALAAEFLRRRGGKLVYLSTANVFDGDLSRPHYEGDALCSDSTYGQFKIACERLLQERLGEDCVILRPPEIYGQSCPRLRAFGKSTREGSSIRTYEKLSVNYTTDVQIAQWAVYLLKHDLRGVFHVGTQDVSDYTIFLDRLAGALRLPPPHYEVERNGVPAYQAVLPGREEIPAALRLTVDGVLAHLSENFIL